MKRISVIFGAGILLLAPIDRLPAAEVSSPTPSQPASLAANSTASKTSPRSSDQVAYINQLIHQGWEAQGLQPSPPATDGEWCRRVYLDVLGRIPSVDEVDRYLRDHTPQKKQNLVNRLLSDEYVEDYAGNWSNIWTTLLIGRPPPRPDRKSLVDREGMEKYLGSGLIKGIGDQRQLVLLAASKNN